MLSDLLATITTFFVILATVPVVSGLYQYLVLAFSVLATHLEHVTPHLPRVSVIIPAWNEGAVLAATIERLMALDYPKDRLRDYVIDDASTDETPLVTIQKTKQYPSRVYHIRRVAGGEGKAHTLNYGLEELWRNDWTEAVLIMDADVIYTSDSLVKMSRHLSDDSVGAVTAYIREGSTPPNLIQRYICFEYITATGASRRAQNVLGFLACLSGGAQLHSRANMLAIGGKIFSNTLAEDTFTTFRTQLSGRRAIFEPNAIVYAEEPCDLEGLWKQRVRWARGNVQITQVFRKLWFNPGAHMSMGSLTMGMLWFSIFLMPIFQISASLSLVGLFFVNPALAWKLFEGFWIVAGVVYIVVTFTSYVVDIESAKKSWLEGLLFPGYVALGVILYMLFPPLMEPLIDLVNLTPGSFAHSAAILFLYAWLALAMLISWSAKELERKGAPTWLVSLVLGIGGYGPFLCAVTFGAYIKQMLGAEMKWDKTIKTGKVS